MSYAVKFVLLALLPGTPAMETGLEFELREQCMEAARQFHVDATQFYLRQGWKQDNAAVPYYALPRYVCIPRSQLQ